jgi:dipeptidyl aminopeptidase/acylaminoacyl peptidase
MLNRSTLTALLVVVASGLMAGSAAAAGSSGAVVFSRSTTGLEAEPAGLFAVRNGRLNQLTENSADSEPDFAPDGRTIVFVRNGDVYAMRADGSGQHALTGGAAVDRRPLVSPNGRFVLFERAAAEGAANDLYTVRLRGGAAQPLTSSAADDGEASFSPDGRLIVFVRGFARAWGSTADLYSVRPSGAGQRRLTRTGRLDEFDPRYCAGGIAFSRGRDGEGPEAYADIFTMRRNGTRAHVLIAGAGSAYVEDVSPNGRLLLFRRDQGLWVKSLGRHGRGHRRARKLTELIDGSKTNAVFSSNGREVAAFVATDYSGGDRVETLSAVGVRSGRTTQLAEGFSFDSGTVAETIGPVIAWQPVRR